MTAPAPESGSTPNSPTVSRTFDAPRPVAVVTELATGTVVVSAVEAPHDGGTIEVSVSPMNPDDPHAEAYARDIRVECDREKLRIWVPHNLGSPRLRGRHPAIAVVIAVPAGSRLDCKHGAADLTVTGTLASLHVAGGVSNVIAADVEGDATVRVGAGSVVVANVGGRLDVKSGTAGVDAARVVGGVHVRSGAGNINLGTVTGVVDVHTGAGGVVIEALGAGRCKAHVGAGNVEIGVQPGTAVHLDLHSGIGTVRSELVTENSAPAQGTDLDVKVQTGIGDVLLRSATPRALNAA